MDEPGYVVLADVLDHLRPLAQRHVHEMIGVRGAEFALPVLLHHRHEEAVERLRRGSGHDQLKHADRQAPFEARTHSAVCHPCGSSARRAGASWSITASAGAT